jgi:site-specific DNA recombinase
LAGIIYCAKCKTHMVGVSTRKQGRKFPYYLCNKRWRIRECDQDYVRADLLEAAIIKDIRTTLRDEDFMARLWAKANELLVAEKPTMKKELARIEGQIAKAKAKLDRYFEAFEAGTMKPDLCNQKVKDLTATLDALVVPPQPSSRTGDGPGEGDGVGGGPVPGGVHARAGGPRDRRRDRKRERAPAR